MTENRLFPEMANGVCSMMLVKSITLHCLMGCVSICLGACDAAVGQSSSNSSKALLVGKSYQEALNERRGISFEASTLRKTVQELQASTGICILLDRRVDPVTIVNLTTPFLSSREIIAAVAEHAETTVSFGESYVLLGPENSTTKIQTLTAIHRKAVLDLRRKLDAGVYRKLSEVKNRSWPQLSQPRQLLTDEADAIGIQVTNPESIPHDVWAEVLLPSMSFSDFAALLLIQFDLTFEISSDRTMFIVPAPQEVGIQRLHRVPAGDKAAIVNRWKETFPELAVKWQGNAASVFATVETHEMLQQLIKGKTQVPVSSTGLKSRLFTFKVPAGTPLVAVVEKFRQSGVPIRVQGTTDEAANKALEQTVEFDFSGIEGSEFFPKVFADINATVTVRDDEVILQF